MCKWGTHAIVEVTMQPFQDSAKYQDSYCKNHPEDRRCQGEWKKHCAIDKCIAPIVQVLEDKGVRMLASCCGHGKGDGEILLLDRTELVVPMKFTNNKR